MPPRRPETDEEDNLLPDDEAPESRQGVEIPPELRDFRDVFDTSKAAILLAQKETDYTIDLVEGG
ncbi:hypothetical protein SPI_03416 [Niveomyces insectorum RCEF 264]|uniref:Uncharacterized protein n=1 Tax=Niveomyces insectorum RCEF 264 TaxID=1081102 RepID=A0A167W2F3_9HYPO|nr:hypothetical protein SPI_03416 [Niveomyces insectorum RCEF 264]